jgi:hypothetical protein
MAGGQRTISEYGKIGEWDDDEDTTLLQDVFVRVVGHGPDSGVGMRL